MSKIVNVKMFFDEYEKYFGDGFYPFFEEKEKEKAVINISFQYKDHVWKQVSQDEITGLDGDVGKILLNYLNNEINEKGLIIKNSYDLIIYR